MHFHALAAAAAPNQPEAHGFFFPRFVAGETMLGASVARCSGPIAIQEHIEKSALLTIVNMAEVCNIA
jgi:hypothetical protein